MPVNYQNGQLYLFHHVSGHCYIGSTAATLRRRKAHHIYWAFERKSEQGALYPHMRTTEAKDWSITLIRAVPCNNKQELEREEYLAIQAYQHPEKLLNVQRQQGVWAESSVVKQSLAHRSVADGGTMSVEDHAKAVLKNSVAHRSVADGGTMSVEDHAKLALKNSVAHRSVADGGTMSVDNRAKLTLKLSLAHRSVADGGTMSVEDHAKLALKNSVAHRSVADGGTLTPEQHADLRVKNSVAHRARSHCIVFEIGEYYIAWREGRQEYTVHGRGRVIKRFKVTAKRSNDQAYTQALELIVELRGGDPEPTVE